MESKVRSQKVSVWDALPFGIGVIAGVLGLTGLPQKKEWVTNEQLIIGLLGLILAALVLFHVREASVADRSLRNLYQDLQLWLARLTASGKPSLDALLLSGRQRRAQSPGWLAEANDGSARVMVAGLSCINLLQLERSAIGSALSTGAEFQFVLLAPDANFLGSFDVQMSYASHSRGILSDIQRAIGFLEALSKQGEAISWRFYRGIPVYSAVWLRSADSNRMEIQFYSYGDSPAERLTIDVDERFSPSTYAYFARSLERLWEASDLASSVGA